MSADQDTKPSGSKNGMRDALHLLNSILESSVERKVSENQILIILDALAGAQDPALVMRFPAVIAICARRGIDVSSQGLLGRYWESSPKRQNLEKLLFISSELFRRAGIAAPRALAQIAESLKTRHSGLLGADYIQLNGGPRVAVADMQAALRRFAADLRAKSADSQKPAAPEPRRTWSARLGELLELLFPDKQKELIFKKLRGQFLTKTEREYYSRVVKKKLAAIVEPELQDLAALLVRDRKQASARKPQGGRSATP